MKTVEDGLIPFWKSTTMQGESLFFRQTQPHAAAEAALLFTPDKLLSITSATSDQVFEEGRDFVLDRAGGVIRLLEDTRIPFKTPGEMYPPAGSPLPRYAHKRGDPATHLIFGEGSFFHRLQVTVTYTHAPGLWKGPVPTFQGRDLPVAMAILKAGKPLAMCATGDSITAGANASQCTDAPPHQPAYPNLVALGLERAYGSRVTFKNFAIGGWQSDHGLEQVGKPAAEKPNLLIVGFGMNDSGNKEAPHFAANIKAIMDRILDASPGTEFILVAPMLPNPEWHYPKTERFPAYRDALAGLCGKGVVLADLTSMWQHLLRRKSFHDLTGNGVNHPNDFGHRVYAEVILSLLVESTKR